MDVVVVCGIDEVNFDEIFEGLLVKFEVVGGDFV